MVRKEECIHRIAWALVPPGQRTESVDSSELGAHGFPPGFRLEVVTPDSVPQSGGLTGGLATLLESAISRNCDELPAGGELDAAGFRIIRAAVLDYYKHVKGACEYPPSLELITSQELAVLARLQEIARESGIALE